MVTAQAGVSVAGSDVHVPAEALDVDGFRAWVTSAAFPEKAVRASFIAGEVLLDRSPESIESHSKVKLEVAAAVLRLVEREDRGEVYVDRVLLSHPETGLSSEPDLFFASWQSLESGRVRLTPKGGRDGDYVEVVGTPDLVVEIVSDSSVHKDTTMLREAYRRAEVPEYWLIDARPAELRFEILRLTDDGHVASAPTTEPQTSTVLDRRCSLSRQRNRAGRFRYELRFV